MKVYAQLKTLSTGYVEGSIPPQFKEELKSPIDLLGSNGVIVLDARLNLFNIGYAHIGQHTAIHEDFLNKSEVGVHKVEKASYNNYKDLALELEQIGYELEILN